MTLDVTPGGRDADSYADVSVAKSHWDATGFNYSAYSDAEIEQALRRATRWIDGRYRWRFPGVRANGREQALEWPRKKPDGDAVKDRDGNDVALAEIPREVVQATAEAARREVAGVTLSPDVTAAETVQSERVGPLEVEYAAIPTTDARRPTILAVEEILSALFAAGGTTRFVMRA